MSTATVDALLAEVDALSAAATPGPWTDAECDSWPAWEVTGPGWRLDGAHTWPVIPHSAADARFIARARTLLPDLAAVVREHREESRRARELIGPMRLELDALRAWVRRAVESLSMVMIALPADSPYDAVVQATEAAAATLADAPKEKP